jgi:hypothetical protein
VGTPATRSCAEEPRQTGLQREKQHQPEQAQAVDQRVEHVGADRRAVGHGLHRAPALQRPDHGHHHGDLQQPDQQPAGGA